jgi:hypothetical protein
MRLSFLVLTLFVLMLAGTIGAPAQVNYRTQPQPIDCAASRLSAPGRHDCRL